MRETADRMWVQARDWFAAMPKNRKIQLMSLTAIVIALAITLAVWMSRTVWVPITSDPANSSQVYIALDEMGVPVKAGPDGITVLVPENRIGDAQMRLREQNILTIPSFDRSIMDDAQGFGVTDAHAKQLYDMQLAEQIRQTLMANPRTHNALVIVHSGETSPFRIQTNTRAATAMVNLTLAGGGLLTPTEVSTIGDIVKGSVPGIEYDDIQITDNNYNSYKIGDSAPDLDVIHNTRIGIQNRLIESLKVRAESMLIPMFGPENVRVQPYVLLNWDVRNTEIIEYAPPVPGELEGLIRSLERIREQSRRWRDAEGIPGTDSNNMGSLEYPFGDFDDNDMYRKAVDSINYDLNQTIHLIEHEQGTIQQMSIGIFINSEIDLGDDYSNEIKDVISSVTGMSMNNVSLSFIPFAHAEAAHIERQAKAEAEQAAMRTRALVDNIMMYAVILLLGLMVMLLGRTIVKAVKPPPEPEPVLLTAGIDGINYLAGDDIDIDRPGAEIEEVELNAKSAGLEQIERFIDKDSASVAQLLRNWLSAE